MPFYLVLRHYIGVILGLYEDTEKENGNYCSDCSILVLTLTQDLLGCG